MCRDHPNKHLRKLVSIYAKSSCFIKQNYQFAISQTEQKNNKPSLSSFVFVIIKVTISNRRNLLEIFPPKDNFFVAYRKLTQRNSKHLTHSRSSEYIQYPFFQLTPAISALNENSINYFVLYKHIAFQYFNPSIPPVQLFGLCRKHLEIF